MHVMYGLFIPQPLPNLFTGAKFIIEPSLNKEEEMRRYLVA